MKLLYLFFLYLIVPEVKAQNTLEVTKRIADYIVKNTPFEYQTNLYEPSKSLNTLQCINFGKNFFNTKNTVAFAYTELYSTNDTVINLNLSYSGAIAIKLNSQTIYKDVQLNYAHYKFLERSIQLQKTMQLSLKKGFNPLIIKSIAPGTNEWIVLLQTNASNISIGLQNISNIQQQVKDYSNFLIAGGYTSKQIQQVFNTTSITEQNINTTTIFREGNYSFTWSIPKIELTHDVQNSQPYWGSFYNYNYHTAGVAWALAKLGYTTKENKYIDYSNKYCKFILDKKPFVTYQVRKLWQTNATDYLMINTPLLDFTSAPCMPFLYKLLQEEKFEERDQYNTFFQEIKTYIFKKQVRLPKGNFTRETPIKYTTWVDDMFMGLPFVIYSANETKNVKEKQQLQNDAANQVLAFAEILFNKNDSLFHHAKHSAQPNINYPYWLRANGWGLWAITEVLKNLPIQHPKYNTILSLYKAHVYKLIQLQDPSGLWHNIANMQTTKTETSGSSIITLAIARGINEQWIPKEQFLPIAQKAWNALCKKVEPDGQVNDIIVGSFTSEDYRYYENQPFVKNDSHGMLCILMCGLEMNQLLNNK